MGTNIICLHAYNKQRETPSSLSRNFFTKRTKELKPAVQSAPGWKLFGKVPPRENLPKDSKIIQQVSKHHTTLGTKLVKINVYLLQFSTVISTLLLYNHRVLWEDSI